MLALETGCVLKSRLKFNCIKSPTIMTFTISWLKFLHFVCKIITFMWLFFEFCFYEKRWGRNPSLYGKYMSTYLHRDWEGGFRARWSGFEYDSDTYQFGNLFKFSMPYFCSLKKIGLNHYADLTGAVVKIKWVHMFRGLRTIIAHRKISVNVSYC